MAYELVPFEKGEKLKGAAKSRVHVRRFQLKKDGKYLGTIVAENGTVKRADQKIGASNLTPEGFMAVALRELKKVSS